MTASAPIAWGSIVLNAHANDRPKTDGQQTHLILGGLAVSILCLRPSFIGQVYSFQASLALVALVAAHIIINAKHFSFEKNYLAYAQILSLTLVIFQWLMISMLAGGDFAQYAMKGLPMSLVAIAALSIVISNNLYTRIFFDAFCAVIVISSVFTAICFVLMACGVHWENLIIGTSQETQYGPIQILFPPTVSANFAATPFGELKRLSGIFREPGVLPPFACWAAAYAHFRRWPLPLSIVALAASAASLSTIGVPLALWTGALIFLNRLGLSTSYAILTTLVLAALFWPIVYSLEFIGLESKIHSQTGSYEVRMDAIETALSAKNIVFGDGPSLGYDENATVNLIGRIRSVGFFGFAFALAPYFFAINKPIFYFGLAPMIATVLFSQPIANDIPAFAICLSWAALEGPILAQREFSPSNRQTVIRRAFRLSAASHPPPPHPLSRE
jgi:hypothetical protein